MAIKIEENNKRKHGPSFEGRDRGRDKRGHRCGYKGIGTKQRNQGESKSIEHGNETTQGVLIEEEVHV